jgi:hypothetical protein
VFVRLRILPFRWVYRKAYIKRISLQIKKVSYNCLYAKLALARAFGVGGLRLLNAVPFAGVGSDGRRHVGRAERGLRRLKLGHILLDQRLQSGAYGPFGRQLR